MRGNFISKCRYLKRLSYALIALISFCMSNIHASNSFNYVPNGSFEVTTISDVPDAWDQYLGPRIVKDWFSAWAVDREVSFHGKNSLRLTVTNDDQVGKIKAGPYFRNKAAKILKWDMPNSYGAYTLSLYLKSNKDKYQTKINFAGNVFPIQVGKKWQRFTFSGKGNSNVGWKYISIIAGDKGILWLDAVQLEEGNEATQFSSSTYDQDLFPEISPASINAISLVRDKFLGLLPDILVISDRSYYTDETNGKVIVKINKYNNKVPSIVELNLYNKSKILPNLIFSEQSSLESNKTIFDLNISKMGQGDYIAEVKVVSVADNNVLLSATTEFRKLKPKSGEVKVDYQRRCLLVDDEPFNLLAATFLRVHSSVSRWPEFLDMLSEHGYTVISATFSSRGNNTRATDKEVIRFFDLAYERGLKVMPVVNPNAKKINNKKFKKLKSYDKDIVLKEYINELYRLVGIIGDHPALLSWYLIDEPFGDLAGSGFTQDLVDMAAKIDPYHPVFISYGNLKRDYDYYDGEVPGDLVAKSYYTSPVRPITALAEDADLMSMATSYNKPVLSFIQLWSGLGRYPTPDELTVQTYLSMIHGATGFISWPMIPGSKILWQRTSEILGEMKKLLPIIYSKSPDINITNKSKYVHIVSKIYQKRLYVIAVNTSHQEQKEEIQLSGSGNIIKPVEVMFENESIKPKPDKMSFNVDLPALSRRVFVIDIEKNNINTGNVSDN